MKSPRLTRRTAIAGMSGLIAAGLAGRALADDSISPIDFGFNPIGAGDQSAILQAAIDAAAAAGKDLRLPVGTHLAQNLQLRSGLRLIASPHGTTLLSPGDGPVAVASGTRGLVLEGIVFTGSGEHPALQLEGGGDIVIRDCKFTSQSNGIAAYGASATVEGCVFEEIGDAAIHSEDGTGLMIRGNRLEGCGNAGIRIWQSKPGHDGSIVSGNVIRRIDWRGGGNGQNGNGVNVYQADSVIVSDNVIADCAFTAVRVNTARNTQVRGNTCLNSGEVAIFSEFGFSGSVIADNIVDGAATGIDITNLDSGGQLATCTGNIVRNIYPSSAVNPDTRPVGIYAEAETVVANNSIENVPGIGIVAGRGTFLRHVVISNNVLYAIHIGIGVSVVRDPSPGQVSITGNLVGDPLDHGIVGLEWDAIVSDDLVRDAANYPHVTLAGNTVSRIS